MTIYIHTVHYGYKNNRRCIFHIIYKHTHTNLYVSVSSSSFLLSYCHFLVTVTMMALMCVAAAGWCNICCSTLLRLHMRSEPNLTFPGSAGAEYRHQERAEVFSECQIWRYGKSHFFMGKSTISTGPFSIAIAAMLVFQRVFPDNCHFLQNQYSSIFLPAMLQFLLPCISFF